jgi:hypothetical protein
MPGFMKYEAGENALIASYPGAVTLSGASGDHAKHYQEKQVRRAIEIVKQ